MIIMPFGKYVGQNIEDIDNYRYLSWLIKQDWVKEKYKDIYNYLKSNENDIQYHVYEEDLINELNGLGMGSWEWWKD
jgi:hypothetical protein